MSFDEKRRSERFPINTILHYMHAHGRFGDGVSIDISRDAVRFRSDGRFLVGEIIELELEWPVRADGRYPVALIAQGVILRTADGWSVASFSKHDLRVLRPPAESAPNERSRPLGGARRARPKGPGRSERLAAQDRELVAHSAR